MVSTYFKSRVRATLVAATALCACIFGCKKSDTTADAGFAPTPDYDTIAPLKVERLDRVVAQAPLLDIDNLAALLDSMAPGADIYLRLLGNNLDSLNMLDGILTASVSAPVRVFSPDVDKRMPPLDSLEMQLGALRSNLRSLYPHARLGRVFSIVSPFRQGVITADSVTLIALNLYLGPKYPGYAGFENYFRSTRRPERMIYDVAEASLAAAYPADFSSSATVLQQMLYEGALVDAVTRVVPGATLAEALGMTPDQLRWLEENEANVWRTILGRDLLYSPSRLDASKLLAPANSTLVIHPDAPGRAGRYIGYRIVEAYLKSHPDIQPTRLLTPDFYKSDRALIDADYNP